MVAGPCNKFLIYSIFLDAPKHQQTPVKERRKEEEKREVTAGPVCIMVEGKVNELFGPTLNEWREDASPGKDERLDFLLRTLGISAPPNGDIRYQLLHRAVSAIITGEQYHAKAAIVLIHSFSEQSTGWKDYEAFIHLFETQTVEDVVQHLGNASHIPLFAVWVKGDRSFLKS